MRSAACCAKAHLRQQLIAESFFVRVVAVRRSFSIALPLAFILMVVHVVASFFCRVFDCAPPVAITAALPLLLVVGTQRLGKSKASSHSPAAAEAGATLKQ